MISISVWPRPSINSCSETHSAKSHSVSRYMRLNTKSRFEKKPCFAQSFAVIAKQELLIEFWVVGTRNTGYEFCNQALKVGEIFIAQGAQAVRDLFCNHDFRSNQPECVNEWKAGESLPLLTEIPKLHFTCVILAKANRLITDQ